MPSQMSGSLLARARQVLALDRWTRVTVWRSKGGTEERVCTFNARIVLASSSVIGRDDQVVQGDASPAYYVIAFPKILAEHERLQPEYEVWADGHRYRVVSVDTYDHEGQAVLRRVQ